MKTDFINAEWIKKYCEEEVRKENENWNKYVRFKNDSYANGSNSGYNHALNRLKSLIETLESLKEPEQNGKRRADR